MIHSFFVPDLLFKRDAIPGRTTSFTFTPDKLGTFHAQCAEFCGLYHSKMTFSVQVVTPVDYQAWIKQQREAAASVTCAPNGTSLSLIAHDIAWNQYCLAVPANTPFSVSITNQDVGIQHNFSIYDSFFEKKNYFTAPKITGPSSETVQVEGLAAREVLLPVRRPRSVDVRRVRRAGAGGVSAHTMAVTTAPTQQHVPEPKGGALGWLTTTDHKKIGILYLLNSSAFFVVAGIFALLMRTELARPGTQILAPHAYNEIFTLHGTLMIFLVIFPLLAGFGNYFVPLQIGALDMAFPRINALSFWLLPVGGLTILSGFLTQGGRGRRRVDRLRAAVRAARDRDRTCGSSG